MIATDNFESVLKAIGFVQNQDVYEKVYSQYPCVLRVDFSQKKLIYP